MHSLKKKVEHKIKELELLRLLKKEVFSNKVKNASEEEIKLIQELEEKLKKT